MTLIKNFTEIYVSEAWQGLKGNPSLFFYLEKTNAKSGEIEQTFLMRFFVLKNKEDWRESPLSHPKAFQNKILFIFYFLLCTFG